MKLLLNFHTSLWHNPLHKLCFCLYQVRTLVAMATLFIVMVILGQLSGERLYDHWSSGICSSFQIMFSDTLA